MWSRSKSCSKSSLFHAPRVVSVNPLHPAHTPAARDSAHGKCRAPAPEWSNPPDVDLRARQCVREAVFNALANIGQIDAIDVARQRSTCRSSHRWSWGTRARSQCLHRADCSSDQWPDRFGKCESSLLVKPYLRLTSEPSVGRHTSLPKQIGGLLGTELGCDLPSAAD